MKTCSKCKREKELFEFYRRKKGPRAGQYYEKCKDCMKIRGRAYYHANHDRQLTLALIRRKRSYYEKREVINKLKAVPCADCGRTYPYYVMDFDHKHGKDKLGDVASIVSWSLNRILNEIDKCEVVCSNCHRIRTYSRICKRAEIAKVVTASL